MTTPRFAGSLPLILQIFLVICASLIISPHSNGQSLDHAIRLMLYHEPEIQAANFDRLSAIEDWKIARGERRPQVSLNGQAGVLDRTRTTDGLVTSSGDTLFSRQIGVSVRQLLYDGGLAKHAEKSAKKGHQAQEYLELGMLEARVVDLCEVYLEVIRAQAQVKEAQGQVNEHKDIREMIKAKSEANGNRADLALVDGRLNLAVNAYEGQKLAYENALIRFVRLTGQPVKSLAYPPVPKLPAQRNALELSGNWDLMASTTVLEAAQHKYESVTGTRAPKIYFDAGASVGEDVLGIEGEDNETRALITMSWDLYNGGANKALRQREHWQVRKSEELVRAAMEEAEYNASLLWKERQGSVASIKTLGAYVERLEGVLADYQEQFKVGRQELLNILDIHGELYSARTQLRDAKFNADTTAFRILGLQGALTSQLISHEELLTYLDRNPDEDEVPQNLRPVSREAIEVVPPPAPAEEKKRINLNPFAKKP